LGETAGRRAALDPQWIGSWSAEDKEQVLDWLNGKLGKYKHPRDVLFVDALPRNEMRKVMKNVLRDMINA
jgi:acyl-coenzyme A synthetase/AMP-(fatty) acid ligase